MRVFILKDSFNPINNGHIELIKRVFSFINVDEVHIFLSRAENCSVIDRLNMIKKAFSKSDFNYKIPLEKEATDQEVVDYLSALLKENSNYEFFVFSSDLESILKKSNDISHLIKFVCLKNDFKSNFKASSKQNSFLTIKYAPDEELELKSLNIQNLKSLDTPKEVIDYIVNNDLYFMKTINKYLFGARKKHSISVANVAYEIAENNKLNNPGRYYIAGLIHDLGKLYDKQEAYLLMCEHYEKYSDLPSYSYHQFIGEYLAKNILKIEDDEILDSIKFHCTGNNAMSLLSKIIYASDKIEPTRGYDSSYMIEAMNKNAIDGFKLVLKENMIFINSKTNNKGIDNYLTKECVVKYLGKDALTNGELTVK